MGESEAELKQIVGKLENMLSNTKKMNETFQQMNKFMDASQKSRGANLSLLDNVIGEQQKTLQKLESFSKSNAEIKEGTAFIAARHNEIREEVTKTTLLTTAAISDIEHIKEVFDNKAESEQLTTEVFHNGLQMNRVIEVLNDAKKVVEIEAEELKDEVRGISKFLKEDLPRKVADTYGNGNNGAKTQPKDSV